MSQSQTMPFSAFAGRMLWMIFGPLIGLVILFQILSQGSGWGTGLDFAYLAVLGAMLLGRWLEFRGGNPQTATGEPATREHLRRYFLGVIAGGLALWVVANAVGNHWLGS